MVQSARQHGTLNNRWHDSTLQEMQRRPLNKSSWQPEEVIDSVRMIFQPILNLQDHKSRFDESFQHTEETRNASVVGAELVHQNGAQV